jgi:uncharacterized SAM-binding protein YcdF (DUF218 family)
MEERPGGPRRVAVCHPRRGRRACAKPSITQMNRRPIPIVAGLLLLIAAIAVATTLATAFEIRRQSENDEARPADVIVVLGAAEYRGRPSPVLQARLNHALFLYLQNVAPRILTTGGAGGDPSFTEGEVGRAYLTQHGVPSEAIVVEDEASTTAAETAAAAEIMQRMNLKSCVVVSDGYHIYRVKKMMEARGVEVYGSPRPTIPDPGWHQQWLYVRQALAYELWRVGLAA